MKNTLLYSYLDKKIIQPLLRFLREGITPHKLALTLAFGIAFGLIPIFGMTTVFCLAAAFTLHLNKPAILLINLAVYPLQLLLYIPFIKIGEHLFGQSITTLTIHGLIEMFRTDWIQSLQDIWFSNLLGIIAWLIIMLPVSVFIYYIVSPFFKQYFENWHSKSHDKMAANKVMQNDSDIISGKNN